MAQTRSSQTVKVRKELAQLLRRLRAIRRSGPHEAGAALIAFCPARDDDAIVIT